MRKKAWIVMSIVLLCLGFCGYNGEKQEKTTAKSSGTGKSDQTKTTKEWKMEYSVLVPGEPEDMSYILLNTTGADWDGAGNLYTADARSCEIHQFSPQGRLLRKIGKKGAGPREFLFAPKVLCFPRTPANPQRTWVVVYDLHKRKLHLFDENLSELPAPAQKSITFFKDYCGNDTYLLGNSVNPDGKLVLFNWHTGESQDIALADDDFLAPFAQYASKSPLFYIYFCKVYAANPQTGGFVVTYLSPDESVPLFFLDRNGKETGKVDVVLAENYRFPIKKIQEPNPSSRPRYMYIQSIHSVDPESTFIHYIEETGAGQDECHGVLLQADNQIGVTIGRIEMSKNVKILFMKKTDNGEYILVGKDFDTENIIKGVLHT